MRDSQAARQFRVAPAPRLAGLRVLELQAELRLGAEPPPLRLCTLPAFLRPGQDESPVELRERGEHGEHGRGLRRVGVGPRLGKRFKGCAPRLHLMHDVEKVARRPHQAIDASHCEHVALVERRDRAGELRPVGPHPAHLFAEDFDGAGSLKGVDLPGMILLGGRHAGIAVFHCPYFATDLRNGQSPQRNECLPVLHFI